jgi:hypothetical protein
MKKSPLKRKSGFKKPRKRLKKKSKKMTISRLRNKVWKVFSLYIRQKGSVNGYNRCVTCGDVKEIAELHSGHFRHGKTIECYFDERNVHPQCPKCNLYLSGNIIEYYPFMEREYGTSVIEEIKNAPKVIWKRDYLEELYRKYSNRLKGEVR